MTISDAIKTMDEVIPPPEDKMIDHEHFRIAMAWRTIKETLVSCSYADKEELQDDND